MKRAIYIVGAALVLMSSLWLARKQIYHFVVTDQLNQDFVDFTLQDLSGGTITASDYEGKILVLDFWGTWCGLCVNAFPEFQKVVDSYQDNSKVAFLAVNVGRGGDSIGIVRDFVKRKEYRFPMAYDSDSALSARLGIKHYPTLMIIDTEGRLRFKHIGYHATLEDYSGLLKQSIESIINESVHSADGA